MDDFTALNNLPTVNLETEVMRHDAGGKCLLEVTLFNMSQAVALQTHLQLRSAHSGRRVLPVYYSDNYISLLPGETRTVTIEAAAASLAGDHPLVLLDGWNARTSKREFGGVTIDLNREAQPDSLPAHGLGVPPMVAKPPAKAPTTPKAGK